MGVNLPLTLSLICRIVDSKYVVVLGGLKLQEWTLTEDAYAALLTTLSLLIKVSAAVTVYRGHHCPFFPARGLYFCSSCA